MTILNFTIGKSTFNSFRTNTVDEGSDFVSNGPCTYVGFMQVNSKPNSLLSSHPRLSASIFDLGYSSAFSGSEKSSGPYTYKKIENGNEPSKFIDYY